MSWLTDIARPNIQALHAYQHAAWQPGLVRLHANELPWRVESDSSSAGLNRYPEPYPEQLAAQLAGLYGVAREALLVARGSDEAIDLLIRSYCVPGRDAVLICPPTFGMYAVAASIQAAAVLQVPLRREAGYALDLPAVRESCAAGEERTRDDGVHGARVRLLFLCSPNNPTGNRLQRNALLQLVDELEGRALVVVDEAYVEFADEPSLAGELAGHPGLALLRTLSKAHGLAGARCGALLAHPELIGLLHKVIQPYAITQPTIEAVTGALTAAGLAATRSHIAALRAERAHVASALAALPGVLGVWPSQANFLMVEFRDPAAALEHAHAAGLLVRDLRSVPGLRSAVRISIGTPEQNRRLLESLSS